MWGRGTYLREAQQHSGLAVRNRVLEQEALSGQVLGFAQCIHEACHSIALEMFTVCSVPRALVTQVGAHIGCGEDGGCETRQTCH